MTWNGPNKCIKARDREEQLGEGETSGEFIQDDYLTSFLSRFRHFSSMIWHQTLENYIKTKLCYESWQFKQVFRFWAIANDVTITKMTTLKIRKERTDFMQFINRISVSLKRITLIDKNDEIVSKSSSKRRKLFYTIVIPKGMSPTHSVQLICYQIWENEENLDKNERRW